MLLSPCVGGRKPPPVYFTIFRNKMQIFPKGFSALFYVGKYGIAELRLSSVYCFKRRRRMGRLNDLYGVSQGIRSVILISKLRIDNLCVNFAPIAVSKLLGVHTVRLRRFSLR